MQKNSFEIPEYIKEETRRRCTIIPFDEEASSKLDVINTEIFHLLNDAKEIDFSIYVRVEKVVVEFIKPNEFSAELLSQINGALLSEHDFAIMVLRSQRSRFDRRVSELRKARLSRLLEQDSHLDTKVISIFENLSSASQLVVKGGINSGVIDKVKSSATFLINNIVSNDNAIATLSRMVYHDPTLYDHSASVAMIAGFIALNCLERPLGKKDAETVAQCGLYHDLGKTCVPSHILNKPGKFTPEEFTIMKTHAPLGEDELNHLIAKGERLDEIVARVAGEHHERFNGGGYPRGRKGRFEDDQQNGIHLFSRIVTIADVYSALLMQRIYKPSYEAQDAIKIMAKVAAEEYDPKIFRAFVLSVVKSLNAYQEQAHGKNSGRILSFDDSGHLQEQKRRIL